MSVGRQCRYTFEKGCFRGPARNPMAPIRQHLTTPLFDRHKARYVSLFPLYHSLFVSNNCVIIDLVRPKRALSMYDFHYINTQFFGSRTVVQQKDFDNFWNWFGKSMQTLRYQRHISSMWQAGIVSFHFISFISFFLISFILLFLHSFHFVIGFDGAKDIWVD